MINNWRYILIVFFTVMLFTSHYLRAEEKIVAMQLFKNKSADSSQPQYLIKPDSIIYSLGKGKLREAKSSLDSFGILDPVAYENEKGIMFDEEKDKELRETLASKFSEAEQAYNNYVTKKEEAGIDIQKLKEAQQSIEKANEIWADNYPYKNELEELKNLISIVKSGDEEELARLKKEQARAGAEEGIDNLIKEAKHCEVDSDCVRAGFGCPFGCGTAINKSMLQQIEAKVDDYNKNQEMICMYDCYVPTSLKVKCVENHCKLQ